MQGGYRSRMMLDVCTRSANPTDSTEEGCELCLS